MSRPTLLSLTVSAAMLAVSTRAQLRYIGCVLVNTSTANDSNTMTNGSSPQACATYCSQGDYSYLAVSEQFCSCWSIQPTIDQTFPNVNNESCYFNCDPPYASEYCGGMDQSTNDFLYSYYYSSISGAQSSVPVGLPPAAAATTGPASPSSPTAATAFSADPASPSSTPLSSPPAASSTTLSIILSASGPGTANTANPPAMTTATATSTPVVATSCSDTTSFTSVVYAAETFTCSDGSLETVLLPEETMLVYYDPAVSTLTTVTTEGATVVSLVPATAAAATGAASTIVAAAGNSTAAASGIGTVTVAGTASTGFVTVSGVGRSVRVFDVRGTTPGSLNVLGMILLCVALPW